MIYFWNLFAFYCLKPDQKFHIKFRDERWIFVVLIRNVLDWRSAQLVRHRVHWRALIVRYERIWVINIDTYGYLLAFLIVLCVMASEKERISIPHPPIWFWVPTTVLTVLIHILVEIPLLLIKAVITVALKRHFPCVLLAN